MTGGVAAAGEGGLGQRMAPPRQATSVATLTVLYDSQCPVCRRARQWVVGQVALVPIEFVEAGSNAAQQRFPQLDHGATLRDITVLDDEGRFYTGDRAWVMVLWAVASTRALAIDVAQGRKRRMFRTIKGATELARSVTANASTPDAPPVPPPPFDGWNAPDENDASDDRSAAVCVGDTCR